MLGNNIYEICLLFKKMTVEPFCHGTYQGTEFTPVTFEIAQKQKVALCLCKATGNAHFFCDRAHTSL
ncbi:MAG: hypothetical protein F6K65_36805 [Moorea sp. SIO3C2]|nr:hypothetical protein [Moorena sp. SIO3C2]